jgi:hypothetical protein
MSEIGERLRALFEEIAPSLDLGRVMTADRGQPRPRRGWLIAVAAAVVALLAGGGWLLLLRGRSEPDATSAPPVMTTHAESTTTFEETSTSATGEAVVELRPVRVECTSELASFPCVALIDDDPDNYWNAPEAGVGETVTFFFSPPVQITEIIFHNVEDPERFARNVRIRGLEVVFDDLPQATIALLEDSREPQAIQARSLRTSRLTITVTSAYPGQVYEGREPFGELALAEIEVRGRVAPDPSGGTTDPQATVTTSVATEPIAGEWIESSIPCCGPWGYISDLLWDGAQFLALVRDPGEASLWRSEDGLGWEQVSALGDFTASSGAGSLDHGDRGYLAGGSVGDEATVWYSADGADWSQVTLGSGVVFDVAVTPGGFVAVGSSHRLADPGLSEIAAHAMVWTSADGLHWQAEGLGPLLDKSYFTAVHLLGQRAVAVGFHGDQGVGFGAEPIVAVSNDGALWMLIDPSDLTAQQFDATGVFPGGVAALEGPDQLLWTSPDGEIWESGSLGGLTIHSTGIFMPAVVTALGGRLVVAGGEVYVPAGAEYNRGDPVLWFREADGTWRWAEGAPALDAPGGAVYMAAASPDRVVLVLDYQDGRLRIWVFQPSG